MKNVQQLTNEINDLTFKIEQEYPELYQYLDENPITISGDGDDKLLTRNFSEYLESLKSLLERHIESHQIAK
jgi:hypothetical protein